MTIRLSYYILTIIITSDITDYHYILILKTHTPRHTKVWKLWYGTFGILVNESLI